MSNFNWFLDGSIILIYIIGTLLAGIMVRKMIRGVDDYLLAGRKVDIYLGIASLAATEFGIVTCMANAELGYKYGFAGTTPGVTLFIAMFIIGKTGFCIKPLRDRGVITIPEFFESKFGKNVRWASGVVIVLGGLLNMGVFLRMGGDFLTNVFGLPPGYLEVMMTIILLIVAIYTILGGMLSVLVTDYMQFVVMSAGLLFATILIFFKFDWSSLVAHLSDHYGRAAFNPFEGNAYGIDRIILDIFVAVASILTWQTMITRVLAAKDTRTGQKIYQATSPFFLVRFIVPAFLGIGAFYYFSQTGQLPEKEILALPSFLTIVLPTGILGILIAGMLAADMSTNSSYMLAWSSVIYNDIMEPIHKRKWSEKKAIFTNRVLVASIGLFLLVYGLWYPLKGDLWVYLQVTATIYLSSMTTILIAACYWDRANNWGAIGAIIVGCFIPISFLIMQEIDSTKDLANTIGPYKSAVAAYVLTGIAMVVGTLLKESLHPIKTN
ncbi:MAG: sodium:solute symporter family protein [Saprospiraceae bacterium]|nr:sodium:solute symporter family protein [Saprospiraceae bacterium]